MFDTIRKFIGDEAGATAIEYGLIAVLICVAMLGGLRGAGLSISSLWDSNTQTITEAINGH
jgi:pilus assembly protein Flp/PilA